MTPGQLEGKGDTAVSAPWGKQPSVYCLEENPSEPLLQTLSKQPPACYKAGVSLHLTLDKPNFLNSRTYRNGIC